MIRLSAALILLFIAMICSSCVEGEEEIWINADASGRLRVHYQVPPIALSKIGDPDDIIRALRIVDKEEEGIEITTLSFEIAKGKATFHLEATFDDATELLEISDRNQETFAQEANADPEQMDGIAGVISFGIEGLTPNFHRAVNLDQVIDPSYGKFLGRSFFKYIIHLPAEVKETNAHEISEDKRTVTWVFPLKEHLSKPMEMSFTTELPIPWWLWLILSLFVLALAWLIWRKLLRPKSP